MKLLYGAFIILTIAVANSEIQKPKLRHHVINRIKRLSEQIEEDNTANGNEVNKSGANETAKTVNDDKNTNNWTTTVKLFQSYESLKQVRNNIDERAVPSNEINENQNKIKDPSKNKIAAREDFVGTMCFDNKERADDGSCVSIEPTASSKEIEEFYKEMKKKIENSALKLEV